ncbi:hypothetical protein EZ449_01290 [Pedobacter frigidisoli]|uniref:Uncharacterized protein n=1 Tax=Pedobacter frigidisoli TaxID=2530455 RepID=A0A4V2MNG7_9SPHI|nr:hypothetical protein [Pedobacter frigidisoli]TCD12706.1 hypothetical protein EZ449_01290 [Pedobacter frigidisoli]
MKRLFTRYPFLFLILAAILIANDILHFAPAQVNTGFTRWLVPLALMFFGIVGYIIKWNEKRTQA